MDVSKMKPDYTFKYIIIGNAFVGKSNIIYRFTEGKFAENYKATINLDFSFKNMKIGDKIYRVQLWDTVGQEEFKSISRGYYKSGVCALVVYDITDRESFNNVSTWVDECRKYGPSTISLVLVGNKIDLENERKISYDVGLEYAKKNNFDYFLESSAYSGFNIDNIFIKSSILLFNDYNNNNYDDISATSEISDYKKSESLNKNHPDTSFFKCC